MLLEDFKRFIQYGDLPTWYYKKTGMQIGKNFNRQSGTKFDISHCWLISIGDDVTIGPKVTILAHDDSIRQFLGYGKIGCVTIGDRVFVGSNSLILMDTRIGNDVIIGAGSIVKGNIPDGSIIAGCPAKIIGNTFEFIKKIEEDIECGTNSVFGKNYSYDFKKNILTKEIKREMRHSLSNHFGYIYLGKFSGCL